MASRRPFLTARWESLILLNYPCPRELLLPLVPAGTELDVWQGVPLVSLVGFLFTETRLAGLPIPFHRTFEEVNLRFYVRRVAADGTARRAVVPFELVAADVHGALGALVVGDAELAGVPAQVDAGVTAVALLGRQ